VCGLDCLPFPLQMTAMRCQHDSETLTRGDLNFILGPQSPLRRWAAWITKPGCWVLSKRRPPAPAFSVCRIPCRVLTWNAVLSTRFAHCQWSAESMRTKVRRALDKNSTQGPLLSHFGQKTPGNSLFEH
jgi:hypothetical protein